MAEWFCNVPRKRTSRRQHYEISRLFRQNCSKVFGSSQGALLGRALLEPGGSTIFRHDSIEPDAKAFGPWCLFGLERKSSSRWCGIMDRFPTLRLLPEDVWAACFLLFQVWGKIPRKPEKIQCCSAS